MASKFAGVFRNDETDEAAGNSRPDDARLKPDQSLNKSNAAKTNGQPLKQKKVEKAQPALPATKTVEQPLARAIGKKRDPKYIALTAYVQRNTHAAAKIALIKEQKGRELSELVQELLSDWVKKQS